MIKNKKYIDWVKTQPCVHTGSSPVEAHHVINLGNGITGSKADDIHAVPLAPEVHREIHREPYKWKEAQVRWLLMTQHRAQLEGVL